MREIRTYGSEGGAGSIPVPTPIRSLIAKKPFSRDASGGRRRHVADGRPDRWHHGAHVANTFVHMCSKSIYLFTCDVHRADYQCPSAGLALDRSQRPTAAHRFGVHPSFSCCREILDVGAIRRFFRRWPRDFASAQSCRQPPLFYPSTPSARALREVGDNP